MDDDLEEEEFIPQSDDTTDWPTLRYSNLEQRVASHNLDKEEEEKNNDMTEIEDWNPNVVGSFIQHAGGIYEKIKIPKVCLCIIDTPAFQRLNNIKQLGFVDRIYRQATHTRFEHSLGVAELARRVMKRLRKLRKDITGTDMLCVIIAALCHDLGHGPFSHSFDPVIYEINKNFRHEELSAKIFDHIVRTEENVKKELLQYLNTKDICFIKEMIDCPKNVDYETWELKGRPVSKQYLYEIVNNIHHGIDIDKLDYIVRDSHHTGVDVSVGTHFISRFINALDIQMVDGAERLTFNGKLASDIPDVFNSRKALFMKVYYHKKVYPIEYQIQKAMRLAFRHLKVRGTDNELKTFENYLKDPIDVEAYIKLDDHIISLIKHSEIEHPDMDEARQCIENVERRNIHTVILKVTFRNIEWNDLLEQEVANGINIIKNNISRLKEDGKIIYVIRHYHFGKGPNVDPSDKVLYRARSNDDKTPKPSSYGNLTTESTVFIYGPHDITSSEADFFYREMDMYLKERGVNEGLQFIFKKSS